MATARTFIQIADLDPAIFAQKDNGSGQCLVTLLDQSDTSIASLSIVAPCTLRATDTDGNNFDIDLASAITACETTTGLAYNGTTGVLTYTDEDGGATNINLPLESFLDTAAFNAATQILTLTFNTQSGLSDINVDLSTLVDTYALTVTDSNDIDFTLTGDGSTGTPWNVTASAILDPDVDNILTSSATGLMVDWCDVVDNLAALNLDCTGLTVVP